MSGGPVCKCEHLPGKAAQRMRHWRVVDRECNYSKFNGSRYTPSRYSFVRCAKCGQGWRTKATYVPKLADMSRDERVRWIRGVM